ncbi:MAG TPA: hypothetical protein VF359_05895, partial [Anaerolineales bacterium]
MHHFLKVIVLFLTMLFAMSCVLFSLPATPVVEGPPTGTAALQSPLPNQSPAPLRPTDTSTPPTPTDTSAPLTPTNTPAPTSLNATGPFIMFKGQGGIWITNPDGSFPTLVSDVQVQGDLRHAISPAGDHIALVVKNEQGLDLVLVNIPGGKTETIAHLISITQAEEYANPTSPKAFATYAIRDVDSVAWQPGDGRLLAFTGAINGPSSDLYLYDTQTKVITQLTSGPSQAIQPTWSPDGQYILNYGVSSVPPFGGAIAPYNQLDGVWAVHVSDGKIISLPKPKGNRPHFVGWQDDSHYITYDSDEKCDSTNLRSVNVASGETKSLMDYSFYSFIALSPENGALLFSSAPGCPSSLGEGTFLLLPGQTTPVKLLEKRAWEIDWMPESKVFFAYPEALLSSDGNTRYDPPVYDNSFEPAGSKEGYQAWEVIENYQGRVEVKAPGSEWKTVLNYSVRQLIWDPIDGRTLLIALGDGSLYSASYPDFTPHLI